MKFFIIATFGIALIFCIVSWITNLFGGKSENNKKIDINNIDKYVTIYSEETGETTIDESKVVRDYTTFYTIQSALQNYIGALIDEDYSKTYSVLSDDMKQKYSKSEYVEAVKELVESELIGGAKYNIANCLTKASLIDKNVYLCECKTIDNGSFNVGIKLNTSSYTYTIFYLEFDV